MAGKSKRDFEELLKRLAAPSVDPAAGQLAPGLVIDGRYKIEKKLGQGGMGEVYEAEHVRIARRVALKCLRQELAGDREALLRFEAEARAATRIGSTHIVEVIDMGELPDRRPYMCMELLEGVSWDQELRKGPLPLPRVLHVVLQLCDALGAAHEHGIAHRDLKPANVFLVRRDTDADYVKLADFGVAKMLVHPGTRLTSTGVALGTPSYMAPEQALAEASADHRVDIHALGVLTFESLTGQLPYPGNSIPAIVANICQAEVPSMRTFRPELPVDIDQIVRTAMAKDPGRRFQSCAEMKRALLNVEVSSSS